MTAEYLYRALAQDADGSTHVHYECWRIDRETKCGVWLVFEHPTDLIFYSAPKSERTWRRMPTKWAHPTREEALQALIERTRAWVGIERKRTDRASRRLANLLELAGPPKEKPKRPPGYVSPFMDSLGLSITETLARLDESECFRA